MNQNKLLIGGTFIYVGAMFFFLFEHFFPLYGQLFQTIGVIHLIIGGIITIMAILSKEKNIVTIQPPKERNCLNCGKAIPYATRICPYCKYDFEQNIKI